MEEREFNELADAMLGRIERLLEGCECDGDFDYEVKPGGILELEFGSGGGKIIINRHTAAREIWVAAKSGGFHFRPRDGRWLGTRDGVELLEALARCMSQHAGAPVRLG